MRFGIFFSLWTINCKLSTLFTHLSIALYKWLPHSTAQVNTHSISLEDVEIQSEDISGLQVASEGAITVALDINVTAELRLEGIAREFVNRIQNLRKESDFEVTDKIILRIVRHPELSEALDKYCDYIGIQTLAAKVELVEHLDDGIGKLIEIEKGIETFIHVEREVQ